MVARGLSYSILLHCALIILIAVGIPLFVPQKTQFTPMAISVDILPVSEISNVPNRQAPLRREEPKPAPTPEKAPPPPPKPVVRETKPEPAPPPKPTPAPEKKPEPKKPEPKPKEEPKKQEDAFDQLLKDLAQQPPTSDATETPKQPTQDATRSKSDRFDPSLPLSLSETDAIRSQFAQHWRLPAGVRNDYQLRVEVRVLVAPDGTIQQAGIVQHQASRYASDPVFRAAADSALRAVKLASPLKGLSPDKYNSWKDMVVNFDPREMLY
jgi:outer membrane biosynthesis protein TonB